MAGRRSGYSRLVGFLGIGLPVIALLLLVALFYISKPINIDEPTPIAGLDLAELAHQSGMGSPDFVGRTDDGSTLRMNASRAFSISSELDGISAKDVTVILERDATRQLFLSSERMEMPKSTETATFTGNVVVRTGEDLEVRTAQLDVAHDMSTLSAPGEIVADGSFGHFTAESMTSTRQSAEGEAPFYLTVFQGGVRLVYMPQQEE